MSIRDIFVKHEPCGHALSQPYIIAEAGVNHEGSMDTAKRLIEEAAEGGADAIKFQTYKAHTLASKNSPAYWNREFEPAESQYALFRRYDRFWKNEYELLKRCCEDENIDFLSTPFDIESANFLNDLMDAYKISSSDITNHPFIECISRFGKPILLSTGASYLWEIQEAVEIIVRQGIDLCLLHCVLNYPTDDHNANLGMILDLRRNFPHYPVGYSDHTMPGEMDTLVTANILGAIVLEKHFTHNKRLPGNDHYHAMDKQDLAKLKKKLDVVHTLVGGGHKKPLPSEAPARQNARRSLVAAKNIAEGEIIQKYHLTWKRPATGISPKHISMVVGCQAQTDIQEDTIINWKMINGK